MRIQQLYFVCFFCVSESQLSHFFAGGLLPQFAIIVLSAIFSVSRYAASTSCVSEVNTWLASCIFPLSINTVFFLTKILAINSFFYVVDDSGFFLFLLLFLKGHGIYDVGVFLLPWVRKLTGVFVLDFPFDPLSPPIVTVFFHKMMKKLDGGHTGIVS